MKTTKFDCAHYHHGECRALTEMRCPGCTFYKTKAQLEADTVLAEQQYFKRHGATVQEWAVKKAKAEKAPPEKPKQQPEEKPKPTKAQLAALDFIARAIHSGLI